jgi:hypothetical protein
MFTLTFIVAVMVGNLVHRAGIDFLPESGVAILFGVALGAVIRYSNVFSEHLLDAGGYCCPPPVVSTVSLSAFIPLCLYYSYDSTNKGRTRLLLFLDALIARFDEQLFTLVLLPIIIYESAYDLDK